MRYLRLPMLGLVCLLVTGTLSAQYPGGYPGQYPGRYPGQYPGGQNPLPRLPRKSKKTDADKKASANEILQQFSGVINKIDAESLVLQAPDTREITFKCTKNTKYFQDEKEIESKVLKPGDQVAIGARSDDEGFFYAVNVKLTKAAKVEAKPAPAPESVKEGEAPPRQQSSAQVVEASEDPDVPKLHRGKPAPRPSAPDEEPEPAVVASAATITTGSEMPSRPMPSSVSSEPDTFLEKAREMANEFSESLPNYLCNQFTTRFVGEGRPIRWQPLDVVSAALTYEDGKESYHDIKINNKAVNKPMDQISGAWSRGEFGTTLRDLFSPATDAEFRRRRASTSSGRAASVYDFEVEQSRSHWQTIIGGQSVLPAYKGSVWIDKKTFRILRIEMQARHVPESFPLDTIEWVVEYSFVRIAGQEFLLPVHAENLSCWRGSSRCARNSLDFRNYRKFTAETTITTTDSDISFENAEPAPAKKDEPVSKKK